MVLQGRNWVLKEKEMIFHVKTLYIGNEKKKKKNRLLWSISRSGTVDKGRARSSKVGYDRQRSGTIGKGRVRSIKVGRHTHTRTGLNNLNNNMKYPLPTLNM